MSKDYVPKSQWELAKYLIDAKKDIDSIMFISENINQFHAIIIKEYIERNRSDFYINLCVILDDHCKRNQITNKNKKEYFDKISLIIDGIYFERDKNYAHKDDDYRETNYNTIDEMICSMKKQIYKVKDICKITLPEVITLDFVPYDKTLFRLINGITRKKEEEILKTKHKEYRTIYEHEQNDELYIKLVTNINSLKGLSKEEQQKFGVILEDGLNYFEGLQNRQDYCILINYIHGLESWSEFNSEYYQYYKKYRNSVFDAFDRPRNLRIYSEEFKKEFFMESLKLDNIKKIK